MRKIIIVLLLVLLVNAVFAQPKKIGALKINTTIKIDGALDELIWAQSDSAINFIQISPQLGAAASNNSRVSILYDDQAIYVGAFLYNKPQNIRKQLTSRDGEQRKDVDYFAVFFDTYNDDQNAVQFLVTTRNVQSDARLLPNLSSQFGPPSDYSWDAVWESKVQMHQNGWSVEMKIPYAALRFSKKEIQDWGVNFERYDRGSNENAYWNKIDPNQNGYVNQFGDMTGLQNIEPPLRLSLLPYVSAGSRTVPYANGTTSNTFLRSGGMDVKYGVNESFTLDATLIPDFGQVVSDNVVLNLTPYEVQFQENRPFFTEGIELFNKSNLLYSRRIGATPDGYHAVNSKVANNSNLSIVSNPGISQLYNAAKFSGRNKKKLGIGVFNALVAPTTATVLDKTTGVKTNYETSPLTNYNILVLDQALAGRSSITLTNSNVWRSGGARNANVTGLDASLFDKTNTHQLIWNGRVSAISGIDNYTGFKSLLAFAKVSGKIQYLLHTNIESDKYDPNDMGFLLAPNEFSGIARISYNQFKPTKNFLQSSYTLTLRPSYLYKPNVFTNFEIQTRAFWFFKNFWDASVTLNIQPQWTHDYFEMRTAGVMIKRTGYWYASVAGSSDSRKQFFFRYNAGFAESPIYDDAYISLNFAPRYRFNDHFSLDIDLKRDEDNGQYGYAFRNAAGVPIAGRRKVTTFNSVVNAIYNFNARMNVSARARHYWSRVEYEKFFNVTPSGGITEIPFVTGKNQNFNVFNIDMFYTWDFAYGSRFIVGWKNWLGADFNLPYQSHKNYMSNARAVFQQPHGNEITCKLIYFLDYMKLKAKNPLKPSRS
jgi:hypothetical protein